MTVMQIREIAMTSPTVNINRDVMKTASRVSNFSVAHLLGETKSEDISKNLSSNKTDQFSCDKTSDSERKSPCSSISEEELDESVHDDDDCDSIVDVEDIKSDKSTKFSNEPSPLSINPQSLIRPTPFSALAAAAWGINGLSGWPGRQMAFRPPQNFSGPNGSKLISIQNIKMNLNYL